MQKRRRIASTYEYLFIWWYEEVPCQKRYAFTLLTHEIPGTDNHVPHDFCALQPEGDQGVRDMFQIPEQDMIFFSAFFRDAGTKKL
jgi:hypothetical protein